MSLVLTNNGELIALKALLNNTAGQDLSLRLFKNDYTPVEASVVGDFQVADFAGYGNKTLTGGNWNFTSGAPSDATYNAVQSFQANAGSQNQYVYGYYLVQVTSGICVYAERFASPFYINNSGDTISVTPKITAD